MRMTTLCAAAALAVTAAPAAHAASPEACKDVRLEQVNWTGVSAKTETLKWMLDELGYETDLITASVPIMFSSLAEDERDAFLGLWLPTQTSMVKKYVEAGDIDIVSRNLDGAKYTLAVPAFVYEQGVRHFSDLNQYKDKFDGRILGIEAGNDGNQIIKTMIEDDAYNLGGWELMASSEAGMLTQVKKNTEDDEWSVFLGWEPHPMNLNMDIRYLGGGETYWGPNKGGAQVYTITAEGYAWRCPNVGQLLANYRFTLDEQNTLGQYVVNEDMSYLEAGKQLIQDKPELLDRWFGEIGPYVYTGIKTFDGSQNAKPVIKAALGME
jgi:glycine betaine/proline transport system substrate-binding protein